MLAQNHTETPRGKKEDQVTYLPLLHNWYHNLALTRPITRNVPRELLHILHQLRLCFLRRLATDTTAKRNNLARYLTLERAKKQLRWI